MTYKWQPQTTEEADYCAARSAGYDLWNEERRQEKNRRARDARYETDFDWPAERTDDNPYGERDDDV